jgi:hypothetical protein
VIVPRQGIKSIIGYVDLPSFFKGRSTPNLIFSLFGCCKILREKNLPANVRDRTFGLGAAGALAGRAARGPELHWDSASVMRRFLRI